MLNVRCGVRCEYVKMLCKNVECENRAKCEYVEMLSKNVEMLDFALL